MSLSQPKRTAAAFSRSVDGASMLLSFDDHPLLTFLCWLLPCRLWLWIRHPRPLSRFWLSTRHALTVRICLPVFIHQTCCRLLWRRWRSTLLTLLWDSLPETPNRGIPSGRDAQIAESNSCTGYKTSWVGKPTTKKRCRSQESPEIGA